MNDNETRDRRKGSGAAFVLTLVGLPLLLFLPLLLSGVEHLTTGTSHVEDFCRTVGIHGFLSKIYRPVFEFFERMF